MVGGINGGSEIVKMWKDYFKGILNSANSASESAEFVEHSINCKESCLGPEMAVCSVVSLTLFLQNQPLNKALGPDFISAEHLLYADESLFFLSVLFNICIVHGFLPNSCLNTTIIRICKNKNRNMSHTSNYRPVAFATVVSKPLEQFILSSISPFLGTTINLAFRLGMVLTNAHFCWSKLLHGLLCNPCARCFFYASKAFDRVVAYTWNYLRN